MRWLWIAGGLVLVFALVALVEGIQGQFELHGNIEACEARGGEWVLANGKHDCYDLERVP